MSALNSVNTNIGAQVALQSFNKTASDLQVSQKRVSTGYRIADATDDGGAYAVAQRVRADVSALTAVNQQLGNAKGLVTTALTGLNSISNSLSTAKGLLVQIADSTLPQVQRDQYVASYKALVQQVANAVDGSTYNGQTLLGAASGAVTASSKSLINNENGATTSLGAADVSSFANTLATLIGSTFSRTTAGTDSFGTISTGGDQTAAASALTGTAGAAAFATVATTISNLLNQMGASSKFIDSTITFNSSKIDSLNAGLGALVDTDLSKESATLQALQIRQQLGTQALSMANQAPQALLSLFKS